MKFSVGNTDPQIQSRIPLFDQAAAAAYLSEGALDTAEEVIVIECAGGVVDVKHLKLQLLHLLKAVVHLYHLGKLWAQGILYPFRPSKLHRWIAFLNSSQQLI